MNLTNIPPILENSVVCIIRTIVFSTNAGFSLADKQAPRETMERRYVLSHYLAKQIRLPVLNWRPAAIGRSQVRGPKMAPLRDWISRFSSYSSSSLQLFQAQQVLTKNYSHKALKS